MAYIRCDISALYFLFYVIGNPSLEINHLENVPEPILSY